MGVHSHGGSVDAFIPAAAPVREKQVHRVQAEEEEEGAIVP